MTINQRIRAYLENRRDEAVNTFTSPNLVFKSVYDQLQDVDTKKITGDFYQELIDNCLSKWLHSTKPINGMLFEYDYIFRLDGEAESHGIVFDGFPIQTEPYGMGFDYSFADNFEGIHGITLSGLNPLIALEQEPDFWYIEGREELTDAYLFTAFVSLHDALSDFVKTTAFGKLNRQLPFHFVIGEHDQGDVYPIYIAESFLDANEQVTAVSTGLDRRRIRYQNYSARGHMERAVARLIQASPYFDRILTAEDLLTPKDEVAIRDEAYLNDMFIGIQSGIRDLFVLLAVDHPIMSDRVAEVREAIQYFSYPENVTTVVQQLDVIIAEDLADTPNFEHPKKKDYIHSLLLRIVNYADFIIRYS